MSQKSKGYIIGLNVGPVYVIKKDGSRQLVKDPTKYKGIPKKDARRKDVQ